MKTRQFDYILSWPPSVNRYWRSFRGRAILSREGRAYRDKVVMEIRVSGIMPRLTGKIRVDIEACPPDNRRRDLDNILKASLDGLAHGGVYLDDSQIDYVCVKRGAVVVNGALFVKVRETR